MLRRRSIEATRAGGEPQCTGRRGPPRAPARLIRECLSHGLTSLLPKVRQRHTLSLATDGHIYVTANQLHRQARYHGGQDLRQKPYVLFRTTKA